MQSLLNRKKCNIKKLSEELFTPDLSSYAQNIELGVPNFAKGGSIGVRTAAFRVLTSSSPVMTCCIYTLIENNKKLTGCLVVQDVARIKEGMFGLTLECSHHIIIGY